MCQWDVQSGCVDMNEFLYLSSESLVALIKLLFLMGETEVQ